SGTLQRALGMGKAAMVSDVGSFAELPDEICLKAPVDSSEEETLFEYLRLLVSRPDLGREMGFQAKQWVERECAWPTVADRYVEFLESVAQGGAWTGFAVPEPAEPPVSVTQAYLESWTGDSSGAREYLDTHITRLEKTLAITPPGVQQDRVLEMGAYMQITPVLHSKLGYGEVRGRYFGSAGEVDHKQIRSASGEEFECTIDLF
ncbi:MAG: glycosyltransferase family 4 protein, partial [bacterium]|nr:glycosyltransferase family 4 protein [bacterium]